MPINSFDNYPLTWRPNKTKLSRPLYKSLTRLMEEDILSGILQKNTRLPSQRELADYLDINFTTVGQAYKYGVEIGLLYTNIGSGTFVSQNALSSITISNDRVQDHIIDFGLVSSFEECNRFVVPHLINTSNNTNITSQLNYMDPLGSPHQLQVAQQWLESQGVTTQIDNIATVSGVQNGLALILTALFSPGDRIAIDRYTYSNFIELATMLHMEVVPIDFDQAGMRPDLLTMECKKKRINGIFLMPSCNNPMGFQISLSRRQELAEIIEKEKLWVIEDDIHAFLTNYSQEEALSPFQALLPQRTLYLAGMTKFLCSGLRIAYLVFPDSVRNSIKKALFNINVKTSGFDAAVISHILSSQTSQEILAEKYRLTTEANALFDDYFHLPRPSNPLPYYRNIPISPSISQSQIEGDFLAKGIRIFHSNRFTTMEQDDPFIRVALSSNNLEILDRGLAIIKKNLTAYQA
ncbi:PLP-dependent aminotransferase family protein [Enterococcus asini]|uniref:aminotransferase-like domain-containing protein n=1 Tax=Enterococcus TaxID=1350 RepID=UPI001956439D|nr:PLP-dependent aminotransferase family protein [Enterococcus asini]